MPKQGSAHAAKVHVKKGDTVQVIAGRDKGKVGEIVKVMPRSSQVLVKGVNIRTRHMKPRQDGESGQIVTEEFPIHSSNVMLYSEKQKVASRFATPLPRMGGRCGC
jgi:large subunit ribosomal protein L24